MSLEIEQKLDGNAFTESEPRIYSTGVFLVPMKVISNGKAKYVWVVDEFNDDTYDDDGDTCSPNVYANSKDCLLEE